MMISDSGLLFASPCIKQNENGSRLKTAGNDKALSEMIGLIVPDKQQLNVTVDKTRM